MKWYCIHVGARRKTLHSVEHVSWHLRWRHRRINNTEESFQGRENDFYEIRKAWSLCGLKSMLYSGNNTSTPIFLHFFTRGSEEASTSKLIQVVGQIQLLVSVVLHSPLLYHLSSGGPALLLETAYVLVMVSLWTIQQHFILLISRTFPSAPSLRHQLEKVLCI